MSAKHDALANSVRVVDADRARAIRAVNERHRRRPWRAGLRGVSYALAAIDGSGQIVGYAMIGPATGAAHGRRQEVRRVVTWGWGAASALYREAAKRGATLTYTDPDERGHSLRAAGWVETRRGRTGPGRGQPAAVRVRWEPKPLDAGCSAGENEP